MITSTRAASNRGGRAGGGGGEMIDFHNHVIPGVDDGAADLEEAAAALRAFAAQGVTALVATPHVNGSQTLDAAVRAARLAELDAAWDALVGAAEDGAPALHRGAEVMLDTPEPELSDPRLRLAGTRFVLLEFPFMTVPPNAARTIFTIRMKGWQPVLAHPERYSNASTDVSDALEWARVGAHLQVNAGSLLGRYGERAHTLAWRLLHHGAAAYVASDHHARGTPHLQGCRAELERRGAGAQAELLLDVNPARLLAGEEPLPVAPLERERRSFWQRLFGRR